MKYVKYIVQKLLTMLPILLVVSFIVFFLLRISGTDPVTVMLGTKQATPEVVQSLREQFHLNEPLFKQYFIWLTGVLSGNLGVDYINKQDVGMLISTRIPVTLGIVVMSSTVGFCLAVALGVVSAINRNKSLDKGISVFMLVLSSVPHFIISILVLVILSRFRISFVGAYNDFGEYMQRITVPALVMAVGLVAMLGRVTRSSMITQLQAAYITTGNAKGMSKMNVTFKHAFHNAVIPVITVAGLMFAGSVGGTVLIEQIFSLPGIGGLLVEGVQRGNYPVVQVLVLFMLGVYLVMSFVVDALYGIVDPRVREAG